ncbi:MAG: hypothetical protein GWN99_00165 [Gemmatimonadetes bacterium]|uniref:Lipoprotein n=1 Tax=Candidatus Kutchimonas denitrificans TaxID=3056748 RepID=A0AAE4Z791_9BACT|nr:hypothetical protein [Gemmatimonadota bacterium]NIR73521.1 hypothetical protein [Candidatus Kutchimonas denitrificans]NIR99480.1 hypothetical protein [Gemmatimonadota bacterium]NIT65100.1 hypothetical protein [Gemmatimonadota bacterium]NIV23633.1 hypothetical protein [Gemmatimonadota bacterium]
MCRIALAGRRLALPFVGLLLLGGCSDGNVPASPCGAQLSTLAGAAPEELVTVVVHFASTPTEHDREFLDSSGAEILGEFKGTAALAIRIRVEDLPRLEENAGVTLGLAARAGGSLNVGVFFVSGPTEDDREFVASLGAETIHEFGGMPALAVRIPVEVLPDVLRGLNDNPRVSMVESGKPMELDAC